MTYIHIVLKGIHQNIKGDDMDNIVELRGVTKIYGEKENQVLALHNVDLEIERGSMVSIVGASGSGKSTLLNIVGGVDTPSDGTVIVDGKEITKYNDDELSIFRRRKVGLTHHEVQTEIP